MLVVDAELVELGHLLLDLLLLALVGPFLDHLVVVVEAVVVGSGLFTFGGGVDVGVPDFAAGRPGFIDFDEQVGNLC